MDIGQASFQDLQNHYKFLLDYRILSFRWYDNKLHNKIVGWINQIEALF